LFFFFWLGGRLSGLLTTVILLFLPGRSSIGLINDRCSSFSAWPVVYRAYLRPLFFFFYLAGRLSGLFTTVVLLFLPGRSSIMLINDLYSSFSAWSVVYRDYYRPLFLFFCLAGRLSGLLTIIVLLFLPGWSSITVIFLLFLAKKRRTKSALLIFGFLHERRF
jgi:hypothetical protein